jgi:hypothetical protein
MSSEERSGTQPARDALLSLGAGILLLAAIATVILAAPGTTQDLPPTPGPVVPVPVPPLLQATASPDSSPSVTVPPTLSPLPTLSPTPGPSATPFVPPGFTLAIEPQETEAEPGSGVAYRLSVVPEGGFNETLTLVLDVRALFVHQQYDLGSLFPPYPQSLIYRLEVPATLPSGITLEGTLRAEGGGIVHEADILLHVR